MVALKSWRHLYVACEASLIDPISGRGSLKPSTLAVTVTVTLTTAFNPTPERRPWVWKHFLDCVATCHLSLRLLPLWNAHIGCQQWEPAGVPKNAQIKVSWCLQWQGNFKKFWKSLVPSHYFHLLSLALPSSDSCKHQEENSSAWWEEGGGREEGRLRVPAGGSLAEESPKLPEKLPRFVAR